MLRLSPKKLEVLQQCANLALHPSTGEGEAAAAALGFFRILKNNGITAKQLVLDGASHAYPPPPPREEPKYREVVNTMPFGRYKGCRLQDIPEDYFDWLMRQGWLKPNLKRRILSEMSRRTREQGGGGGGW